MNRVRILPLLVLLALACLSTPSRAQNPTQPLALGLVSKTFDGEIDKARAAEGASVYSGDYLSTNEHGSLLVRIGELGLELQSSSAVHIYRTPYGAVVELNRGSVLYSTPGGPQNLVIVASDVRVTPSLLYQDSGRVTIDDPCNITVYSQHGQVNVKVGSESRNIEEGKSYRVRAEQSITYREYVSPDADNYHHYHDHTPCAPVDIVHGHTPIAPGQSHFVLAATALAGAGTGIAIWKNWESPDRP
jgi:hypothetical protein